MGMFSWECKGCGKSILSIHSVQADGVNKWMMRAVAQLPNGSVAIGEYDGYGRIKTDTSVHELDGASLGVVELWHEDCWKKAGKPAYEGPSESAKDQGFFFEDGTYDQPSPLAEANG